jgi:hypothetical protein
LFGICSGKSGSFADRVGVPKEGRLQMDCEAVMDNKRLNPDHDSQPLIKYGPGGDYQNHCPPSKVPILPEPPNGLGRLLSTIAEMIGATIHPELMLEKFSLELPEPVAAEAAHDSNPNAPDIDAQTNRGPAVHCGLPVQPSLFGDDRGDCRPSRRKPAHRIRAHRRPARKRPAGRLAGEGTLFAPLVAGTTAA